MSYRVKELFFTLQGEGARTGRPAVFCRFSGCNLWSGREAHRASATCTFCDTDFVGTDGPGGATFSSAGSLAAAAAELWPKGGSSRKAVPYIVCTGGEPLLQMDAAVVACLHDQGFEVAVETNGTIPAPPGIDWTCVSPKAGTELAITSGDELKLVFPQPGAEPRSYEDLAFTHRFLQPMDGPTREEATRLAVAYCLAHPSWRLSLQTHKLLGIP